MPDNHTPYKQGKPWNIVSKFSSFDKADIERNKLKAKWEKEKKEGMEVKIKRMSSGVFTVRTRLHPDFEVKKGKKNGKNIKRNNKNSDRRKNNVAGTI